MIKNSTPARRRLHIGTALQSLTLVGLGLGMASFATAASAQAVQGAATDTTTATTTPAPTGDIVVTGSRIQRPDLQSSSPVATISAGELKATNTVTAESYLSSSPQFVPAASSTTNNGNGGTATVDLRGLGSQRTLVLVNGRRMVPSDIGGAVDINAIPTVLIKRVDVLTGGASAVYGADAISGVVNFVLDDKLEGVRADASSQVTGHGDAAQYNAGLAAGVKFGNDDAGHIVIAGQYTKRDGVYQSARAYSAQNLDANLKPSGSSNATPTVIDINSGRYQVNDGSQAGGTDNFVPYYKPYNFNPANYLQVPLERYNATALASYKFSDAAELYARGSYTRSDVTAILAPTATAGFNFTISPNNPFLNAANSALIFGDPKNLNADGTANVGIRRRVTETGGRIQEFTNDTYFGIVGLRGDFADSFHYDVFAQYGLAKRHEALLNDLDYNRTAQAINATVGANGTPVCANPANGCVPVNLFTSQPISAAALSFITANGAQDNRYTQFVTGGSLSGDLNFLQSPLADKPAAVALGAEYRRETGSQSVDANYGSGNLIYYGQGTAVPNASFDVKEIYGELQMPLVTDRPFVRALNFEGGVRYSSYTNNTVAGRNKLDAVTYKLGGDWSPVEGVRFRAIFNRATRDPNIAELNSPITQAGTDVLATDPCANGSPQGNATLAAKCIAQGAPATLVNSGVIQDVTANQTNINAGGNPALRPETANTLTAGAVFSPRFLRGLNVTVDYYRMKVNNYIASDGSQDIVNQCFNNNISAYCSLIVRNNISGQLSGSPNANGQFPGVTEQLINVATLKTSGIDVSADYRFTLPGDGNSLTLNMAGTYVDSYTFNLGAQATPINCAGKFGNSCAAVSINPIPRWKHQASAVLDLNGIAIQGRWRYVGPVSADAGTPILASRIPSYSYIDTNISFDVNKQYTFRVGVSNLFNINPPIVGGSAGSSGANSGNTFPNVYDALGRTFFAGISLKL
jgi:hypothetical protein